MTTDTTAGTLIVTSDRTKHVSLSKWVNEPLPALNEILSAHEVTQLTRRRCWVLVTLSLLGKFPLQQQYRGRPIGWRRTDVESWLAEALTARPTSSCLRADSRTVPKPPCRQGDLFRPSSLGHSRPRRRCFRSVRRRKRSIVPGHLDIGRLRPSSAPHIAPDSRSNTRANHE